MNKRLVVNLIANIISYSTTVLVAFFLTPFLVKTIGIEAYGFYPMAQNITNYVGFLSIALNSMASRFITIEIVKGNNEKANTYFTSIFISNLILAGILFLPMVAIVVFINSIFDVPTSLVQSVQATFALVFISFLVQTISSVFGVAVFAKDRTDYRSYVEIAQAVMRVLLYIVFYSFFNSSIVYVGLVAVILALIYAGCHYVFTKKLLPLMKISMKYFNLSSIKEILFSGIWNSINQLGSMMMFSISIILANILISSKAAGEFSIIQVVPGFISGIISMLTAVFLPLITHKYAQNDINGLIYEVKKSQVILGLITNIPIAVFIAVGKYFYMLWVPSEDSSKLQILSVMVIAYLLICGVVWPISNLNTVMNRVKVPALFMVANGAVNILLIVIICKTTDVGIFSISISMMVLSILYFSIFIPIYPCKALGVDKTTFYPAILKTIFGAVIIYFITIIIMNFILVNSWVSLLIVCGISGVLGIIVNYIIIFSNTQRKNIIKFILKVIIGG